MSVNGSGGKIESLWRPCLDFLEPGQQSFPTTVFPTLVAAATKGKGSALTSVGIKFKEVRIVLRDEPLQSGLLIGRPFYGFLKISHL